jgi:tRNA (guanine-N1)-methyltransferase
MRIDAITIFPDYFAPLQLSLLGRAQDGGLLSINVHDLRSQTSDTHHTVDDAPYGGGAGMVMLADVWGKAIDSIIDNGAILIAGVAALVAGSISMAGGEYASVSAQRDSEIASRIKHEGSPRKFAKDEHVSPMSAAVASFIG